MNKFINYKKRAAASRSEGAKFQRLLDEKARKGEGYLTGKASNTKTAMKLPLKVLQKAIKLKLNLKKKK
jgi:hypothetical protein